MRSEHRRLEMCMEEEWTEKGRVGENNFAAK